MRFRFPPAVKIPPPSAPVRIQEAHIYFFENDKFADLVHFLHPSGRGGRAVISIFVSCGGFKVGQGRTRKNSSTRRKNYKMYLPLSLILLSATCLSAPATPRDPKNLPYFEYLTPEEYDYEMAMGMENDISRTIPKRKPLNPYNSPIYYIRLPPQPYMFVPGMGYISQPPPPPPMSAMSAMSAMSPFVTLPVNFVSNGKPSGIYQWSAGVDGFGEPPKPQKPQKPQQKPQKPEDSAIHQLEGQFVFNGKPDKNVIVLRDSYNALYGDALQNFYP